MTKLLSALFLTSFFLLTPSAHAFRADHFKGIYEVLGEQSNPTAGEDKKYVICDVDTVANIWAKYANGDLPADLVKIKNEPSILLGFTFRNGLFFNLEAAALVGENLLAMPGGKNDTMQLKRINDDSYELGVRIDNVVTFYNLGARIPMSLANKRLPETLHID